MERPALVNGELRGAARPGAARERRALLRRATRSSRRRWPGCSRTRPRPTPWAARAAPTSRRTTPGTWSWRSTSGCWPRGRRLTLTPAEALLRHPALRPRGGGRLRAALPLAGRAPGAPAPGRDRRPPARSTTWSGATTTRRATDTVGRHAASAASRCSGPRSEHRFALVSDLVFHEEHTLDDERRVGGRERARLARRWSRRCAAVRRRRPLRLLFLPLLPELLRPARRAATARCWCPTAEEDPAIELPVFGAALPRAARHRLPDARGARARPGRQRQRGRAVGRDRQRHQRARRAGRARRRARALRRCPSASCSTSGRIDRNKGADSSSRTTSAWRDEWPDVPPLVLVGKPALPIPEHPKIRHLGFVSEEEKFALLAGLRRAA